MPPDQQPESHSYHLAAAFIISENRHGGCNVAGSFSENRLRKHFLLVDDKGLFTMFRILTDKFQYFR